MFQYMLLLRGATLLKSLPFNFKGFQYMLLLRGATKRVCKALLVFLFQYMLLLRGATVSVVSAAAGAGFNTCSSCEEQQEKRPYYSTIKVSIHAPLARSNEKGHYLVAHHPVSIHAPLARSNFYEDWTDCMPRVSIHAPLARSNCERHKVRQTAFAFQYMLLLRGATPSP